MKITKKLILGLGTLTAIAAPVAVVVSCDIDSAGNVDSPNAPLTNKEAKELNKNLTQSIDKIVTELHKMNKGK